MAKKLVKKQAGGTNKETGLYVKPTVFQSYLNTTKGAVPSDTLPKKGYIDKEGRMTGVLKAANPKNTKKLVKAFDDNYKANNKKTGGTVKSKKK